MKKIFFSMFCGLILFAVAGCSQSVLKQEIPVSTNPLGAKIYANGQLVGVTPISVGLERNRNHILTLIKENYRQEDVVISRHYQKEKVYLKAIQSGINSGLFFKDAQMGIGSSMSSISSQEGSGEAYILTPAAVKVTLTPVSGFVPAASEQMVEKQASTIPVDADDTGVDKKEMAKGLLKVGAAPAVSQNNPLEKKKEISSSTKNYIKSDGTRVTEKSSTSVGVGLNPSALIDVLDILF